MNIFYIVSHAPTSVAIFLESTRIQRASLIAEPSKKRAAFKIRAGGHETRLALIPEQERFSVLRSSELSGR